MILLEVLVEGKSDAPAIKEALQRKFRLIENFHFRVHAHKGKGKLPAKLLNKPDPKHRGLLDQLPAKLIGYGKSLQNGLVLVVIDADDTPPEQLAADLESMLTKLPIKPRVLFCLAVEETESWFIADIAALELAYPKGLKKQILRNIEPDAVVGAWEKLAAALSIDPKKVSGVDKYEWALRISPHLDLDSPKSPSFNKLIADLNIELKKFPEIVVCVPLGQEFGARPE